jgi:hypothetical protein
VIGLSSLGEGTVGCALQGIIVCDVLGHYSLLLKLKQAVTASLSGNCIVVMGSPQNSSESAVL